MHTLWSHKALCVSTTPRLLYTRHKLPPHVSSFTPGTISHHRYYLPLQVLVPTLGTISHSGYHLPGKVYSTKYSIKTNPISVAQQHTKEQCVTCHQYSRSVVYLRTKRTAPKGCPVFSRRFPKTLVIATHLEGRGGHAGALTCSKTDNQLVIQQSKGPHLMQLTCLPAYLTYMQSTS